MTAAARVLLIDEPFVRRYFRGEDPIGMHIRFGEPVYEIIGVVGGVRNHNLRTRRARRFTFRLLTINRTRFTSLSERHGTPMRWRERYGGS